MRRLTALGLLVVAAVCGSGSVRDSAGYAVPLEELTVALGNRGAVVPVADVRDLVPGTRVVAGTPQTAQLVQRERSWLAVGRVPRVAELGPSTMVRDALLDLHVLTRAYGVPVAGWTGPWRYVWPRDSALVAAALARTGHLTDAVAVIDFLQGVQPASGVFAARYLPDASGVPDDRGDQLDGTGWALWATAQVAAQLPTTARSGFLAEHRVLIDRSSTAALAAVTTRSGLPAASPDYWEVRETRGTLATAALLRAGLAAAGQLYAGIDDARAGRARVAADGLAGAIARRFAPHYPRHPGDAPASIDLGVGFLLPPFAASADPAVLRAWQQAPTAMARPGGGLAPGGSWRQDGISWTTATSSYALTAAAVGDRAEAVRWLRWLDSHRTAAGSLPEKVKATGAPAAVAPLAWAAAAVILAASDLAS